VPQTIAQFLNQDLDALVMRNVDVAAFYKTVLIYVQNEMENRQVETFAYEPPVEMPDGSFRMRIHYGPGGIPV
jgi:hypothetical protein